MTRHLAVAVLAVLPVACASSGANSARFTPVAPLELRAAQTRYFDAVEPALVLQAALDVLQDEGFVIRQTDSDLGLITAVYEQPTKGPLGTGKKILRGYLAFCTYGLALLVPWSENHVMAVEASVSTSREGDGARARIALVTRRLDGHGQVRESKPVSDPRVYQNLLARLDLGVFLRREGL